ncbi:sugar phosphate permease [Pseudomonas sp. SJZ103]|uniref:MFS transporter n=1 Tax=unclassified Pseudomonas TaxID=196821 RepID=UPI00103E18E2|nr:MULTISPECIES: MFS transporter [unclassified Pseudomonas]MBB6291422.1 MFS family permease [Pseudomonas sp. SJZ073]MBB6316480.1 MFS family permease [Pseudomonas sp. JAI120]MCS4314262.1 MFS family permease [Pseudomonas sp. BIGb0381]NJJ55906.1 MFS transporter [Pseudomonas sp. B14(2022)]TWC68085.1 sugar phosphate permease [Pseudomonas sp. SJZ103]
MDTVQNSPDPRVLARAAAKVKRHVLPLFVVMFIVNYIDRVNIGFVRSHLETDLGIGAAAYGLGAGLFFIGYAIFEVPSNLLLQRYGARAWLTRIMFTWGAAAMAMAFVKGETSFYILRFVLGAAEAGFFPGIIYYFTQWLPAAERGKAMAIFLSGSAIASVISGPVSGALLNVSGLSLHGWQWMFLIEGFASVVLCGFVWFWLQSHPHQAKWLSDEEKHALVTAIALEQTAREATQSVRPSMFKLLADKQIALFCFIYFSIALTIYGATFWLPSMIKKMGNLGDFQVGLFNSIPWLISIVAMYGFAALASKWKHQQAWVALMLVIAAVGMFMSTMGGPVFAFVAICFAAIGFKAASALFWPIPQGYLDARIAAAVIALINSVGNLGGFVAPTTFGLLEQTTGSIEGGLYGLAATSLVAAVVVFFARTAPRPGVPPTSKPTNHHHALRPGPQGAAS